MPAAAAEPADGNGNGGGGTGGGGGGQQQPAAGGQKKAPQDSGKLRFLFSTAPKRLLSRLQLDEVAMYSVTDDRTAQRTADVIAGVVGRGATVADATACVGGNTIAFARTFRRVVAVELDARRAKMLKANLKLFGVADKVRVVQGDYVAQMARLGRADAVFVDPPWGGTNYSKSSKLRLRLGDLGIPALCDRIAALGTQHVFLKLPTNADVDHLRANVRGAAMSVREQRKMLLVHLNYAGAHGRLESWAALSGLQPGLAGVEGAATALEAAAAALMVAAMAMSR